MNDSHFALKKDNTNHNTKMNNESFLEKIIIPANMGATKQNIKFRIHDLKHKMIIVSDVWAKKLGFKNSVDAMNKTIGIDCPYKITTQKQMDLKSEFLIKTKRAFDFLYRDAYTDNTIYITTAEPIFNLNGEVIGSKELDRPMKILSHRDIIEHHFKRFGTNAIRLTNLNEIIKLNEKEEIILFMLIGGYSQQEIADFLKYSRSYIVKIINENLCPKFGLPALSTKILIDKAVSLGYSFLIPNSFLNIANERINI